MRVQSNSLLRKDLENHEQVVEKNVNTQAYSIKKQFNCSNELIFFSKKLTTKRKGQQIIIELLITNL